MDTIKIAKAAHEANRVYCKSIGDNSQPAWDDAPEWQRDSAVKGVNFHYENPDATPEDSHKNWYKQKLAEGWEYGEVKDPEKKQHPCMTEYNNLPEEQKVKDELFMAIVKSLF